MKRWISVAVCLAMVLMLVPSMAMMAGAEGAAASTKEKVSGAYTYVMVDEETVEIVEYAGLKTGEKIEDAQADAATTPTEAETESDAAEGEEETSATQAQSAAQEALTAEYIAIPDTLDDFKVVSIGRAAFKDCCVPEKIMIPDGVTTIGREAFAGCTALEQVVIPDSVTTIERGAFKMCAKLKTVTIPDSVTVIEKETFFGCAMLNNIVIPATMEEIAKGAFMGCDNLVITADRGTVAETYATENDIIFQEYQSFMEEYGKIILIVAGVVVLIVLIIVAYVLVKRAQKKAFKKEIAEQKAAREAKYGKRRPEDNI